MIGSELIIVDFELINRLRNEGKWEEAEVLIKAHQSTIKKNYYYGKRENQVIRQREKRFHLIKNNLCVKCKGKKESTEKRMCLSCRKGGKNDTHL